VRIRTRMTGLGLSVVVAAVLLSGGAAQAVQKGCPGGPCFGTEKSDTLFGGDQADYILGLGGRDSLIGDSGQDVLMGGKGSDELLGLVGADLLRGGPGDDTLNGVSGRDVYSGGAGNDLILAYGDPRREDVISCGDGFDDVRADLDVARDCEIVYLPPNIPMPF